MSALMCDRFPGHIHYEGKLKEGDPCPSLRRESSIAEMGTCGATLKVQHSDARPLPTTKTCECAPSIRAAIDWLRNSNNHGAADPETVEVIEHAARYLEENLLKEK